MLESPMSEFYGMGDFMDIIRLKILVVKFPLFLSVSIFTGRFLIP